MVLNELYNLYHLLASRGVSLPRMGWSVQKVSFRVVITPQGGLVRIENALESQLRGPKKKPTLVLREMMLPGEAKPSGSGVNPCFLWDNAAYLLGCEAVKPRALEYFSELRKKYLQVESAVNSPAFSAVCRFLENWQPGNCAELFCDKALYKGNGVFRLAGEDIDVHEDPQVVQWWDSVGNHTWRGGDDNNEEASGICLITGQAGPVAMLHEPSIKGVADAQTSGAKLVSFNCKSFESYGKEQSTNSPVSPFAAFAYTNALNYLLSRSDRRLRIGDATTVFWTDAPVTRADDFDLFALYSIAPQPQEPQDNEQLQRVQTLLRDVSAGKLSSIDLPGAETTRFFILGLSPNAARLSVRFFWQCSFGDFIRNIASHYSALRLVTRGEKFHDPEFISPYMILRETGREAKDVPPTFAGSLMRSIFSAQPYPSSIATAILRRIRIERRVNYVNCAYLKAWLTRKLPNEIITTMLDKNNTHPGYLLGRAFALLQKNQDDYHRPKGRTSGATSQGKKAEINRTLREAFYATASTSPRSTFPRLFKLTNHHLASLPQGLRIERDKMLQEILGALPEIPARLNLTEQAFFALGFYHQMQDFFTPATPSQEN